MSNFRRMLMMLAQDLPKRESIVGKSLVEGFEYNDGYFIQGTGSYAGTIISNTNYSYTSPMQFYEGDYIECYVNNTGGTATSFVSKYRGDEKNPPYTALVKNGSIDTREYTCDEDCLLSFCQKKSFIKSADIYVTRTISQAAYDYALSFGKKVVKDLKKVIEQSENPALLIKRINDWKYLIHSLVDTGYTSWLKGDGSAWIDSGIVM